MPKANRRVMEKEKMVASNGTMGKVKKRASRREMEQAKMMERERERNSRKTSAIEIDRQAATEAMQALMVREALQVAAPCKGLL